MSLHLHQGNWSFVEGPWHEDAAGVLTSPRRADRHLAFYRDKAYRDLEARFEFRRDGGHSGIGLIVRASDARRYHVAEIPCCGQQIREGHFWAAITRAEACGWATVLGCERVPGVPCEAGLWQQARVVVRGDEIRFWINGRPLPPVRDATMAPTGLVGLLEWGGFSVRGLEIGGTEVAAPPWDDRLQPVRPWFLPCPSSDQRQQGSPGPTRAPNGDLLMVVNQAVVRSTDQGRTWQELWQGRTEDLCGFQTMGIGTPLVTRDGHAMLLRVKHRKPFLIEVARSPDGGRTWSAFEPAGEVKLHPAIDEAYMYGSVLELRSGALLFFGYTYGPKADPSNPDYVLIVDGIRYRPAQIPGLMNFCIRSEDGGRTWSGPVNIDGPNPRPALWMSFKDQASEVTAIETLGGEIVAWMRPGLTWALWETRSQDGGRTWAPLAAGPFLSYACAAPPRATASGALVVGGRFPALAIQVSRDQGLTWQAHEIDTEPWAMGGMIEVAPDVLLWVYGSGASQLRAQYIRITPTTVEPALEMLPAATPPRPAAPPSAGTRR